MNKRPPILYLIFAIPLSSLMVGMVMLLAALNTDSGFLEPVATPLNKTSWQHAQTSEIEKPQLQAEHKRTSR